MHYIIIDEPTPADLQIRVNMALKNGYLLQGGVSVGPSVLFKGIAYAQAMVKPSA